jgi:adenylate cyclase class IV
LNRNVEIKARLSDPAHTRSLAAGLSDGDPVWIEQRDTFFSVGHGRLKLREFADGSGELIWYQRPDRAGPGESSYRVVATRQPARLAGALGRALGVRGVVEKRRELFRAGRTRIHLDEVEGLGAFLELEVVLEPEDERALGEAIALDLMRKLAIRPQDLVEVAYIDLLEAR